MARFSLNSIFPAVCILAMVAGAILAVVTVLKAGPGWDDPLEIYVMNKKLKVEAAPGLSYEDAKRVYGSTNPGHVYYGIVLQYAAHTITALLRGKPWLAAETPRAANIAVRHTLTLLLAFLGVAILAGTSAIVGHSREFGLAVGAILMTTPVFIGQSAINVKDVPVAVGITMVSCGAALLLMEADRVRRWVSTAVVLTACGTFLAVGMRTGAVALVAFQAAVIGALLVMRGRWQELALLALGVAAGLLAAVVTDPFGRKAPLEWLWDGVTFTHRRFRAEGIDLGYVPRWIFLEYPIPFLLLAAIGAVVALKHLRRGGLQLAYPWLPFLVQGALLPLIIVLSQSLLYDRLRHIFFIVPPLCLLAALGLYACFAAARSGADLRHKAYGLLGAASLAAIFAASLLWVPYQYAYLNAIGRLLPQHSLETDYWGVTIAEGVERMKEAGVKELRAGPAPIYKTYSGERDITVSRLETPVKAEPGFYVVHPSLAFGVRGLPESCRVMFRIERQGTILGEGGECGNSPSP